MLYYGHTVKGRPDCVRKFKGYNVESLQGASWSWGRLFEGCKLRKKFARRHYEQGYQIRKSCLLLAPKSPLARSTSMHWRSNVFFVICRNRDIIDIKFALSASLAIHNRDQNSNYPPLPLYLSFCPAHLV